jgi:hypothetical protein
MEYTSHEVIDSKLAAGVRFSVAKMSFGRRVELTRRIRELATRREYLEAGETPNEKMEAALLASEIDRIYLLWGLRDITGLELDGLPATPESLAASGPEDLFREALALSTSAAFLKPKEKTNRRPPFSIFRPGRLGVRELPKGRTGDYASMRLAALGSRNSSADGVG